MYVGQPLPRPEDFRFLTGRGNFVDDIKPQNCVYLAFLRSPHAHAKIVRIDAKPALACSGVLRIVTAEDWAKAGLGKLVCVHPMPFTDGRPMREVLRPVLASGEVHHVGDVVAAVVAETRYQALDALEAIEVEYEPLPAVAKTGSALDNKAPIVHEQFGTNQINEIIRGDKTATAAAFAKATHTVAMTLTSNRVAGSPLEPRSYVADYSPQTDQCTLWATTQVPHMLRRWICKYALFIPEHKLRVISPDVGGGFGQKVNFCVEISTVVWMARELNRPVKWTSTRMDALLSDTQARDHVTQAEMAFDKDGKILGAQGRHDSRARRLSQQLRAQHSRQFISADHHRAISRLPHSICGYAVFTPIRCRSMPIVVQDARRRPGSTNVSSKMARERSASTSSRCASATCCSPRNFPTRRRSAAPTIPATRRCSSRSLLRWQSTRSCAPSRRGCVKKAC